MLRETQVRQIRRRRYLRLAALHAGPMGPALIGHPELGPQYPKTYARCPGFPKLACAQTGGTPRVCLPRRFQHMARLTEKGGPRRRAQQHAYLKNELIPCIQGLLNYYPPNWRPVLEYTLHQLEEDLAYLEGRAVYRPETA
ncbi:hypothetical protein [Marinithermus hydrothermalis]|uniref:Uncharacterized protein n=1 Tax=Marinithermus hydrothermalis (strain DSM 14884 / JCM 11576 / T1) TaxID=869210 RepID=F2NQZ2_MARHT|nr:hypothetical protein [Marinithermus hydrothermalis]AEB12570.1 hypothetical protein Marky_1838 [Marinithermus hydrothermalis DSM 14884]